MGAPWPGTLARLRRGSGNVGAAGAMRDLT